MGEVLYSIAETVYPFAVTLVLILVAVFIGKIISKWATKDAPKYEDDGKGGHGPNFYSDNYRHGPK